MGGGAGKRMVHAGSVVQPSSKRRTYPSIRVNSAPVDIEELLRVYLGSLVGSAARAVKDTTKHAFRDAQLHAVVGELDPRLVPSR